jgi:hypothetical protein
VQVIDDQNMTTGLSLSEQLYTARGSQSAGISQMAARALNINGDNTGDATFLFEVKSHIKNMRYIFRKIF